MRENKFDRLISTKPNMFIIKSKNLEEGLDIKISYSKHSQVRNLCIGDKEKLIDAMKKDTTLFLEKIIDWHLENEKILSYTKGNNLLLPTNYQRLHDECIEICTQDYKLYIVDKAIERCSNIVYKLSERSKRDCFKFVMGKLNGFYAEHLYISLNNSDDKLGRYVLFEGEEELDQNISENTVCYNVYPKEDGTYDEDDINNILTLIEAFTHKRGMFKHGKTSISDLVMYNSGIMKIHGIDKDKRLIEKAKRLMR